MATTFWLSMGYNFGCMIASDTLFDSRGGFPVSSLFAFISNRRTIRPLTMCKLSDENIADFEF